jgi:ABC-2 type transport system permease protein
LTSSRWRSLPVEHCERPRRGVAHLTIYLPAVALYFIVLPRFYGFSTPVSRCNCSLLGCCPGASASGQAAGAGSAPGNLTVIFSASAYRSYF